MWKFDAVPELNKTNGNYYCFYCEITIQVNIFYCQTFLVKSALETIYNIRLLQANLAGF